MRAGRVVSGCPVAIPTPAPGSAKPPVSVMCFLTSSAKIIVPGSEKGQVLSLESGKCDPFTWLSTSL